MDRALDLESRLPGRQGRDDLARTVWTDIPADRDPLLRSYVMQLNRLIELRLPENNSPRFLNLSGSSTPVAGLIHPTVPRTGPRRHQKTGPICSPVTSIAGLDLNRPAVRIENGEFEVSDRTLMPPTRFPPRAETTRSPLTTSGPLSSPSALFCGCCFFPIRRCSCGRRPRKSIWMLTSCSREQILKRTQSTKDTPSHPRPCATPHKPEITGRAAAARSS